MPPEALSILAVYYACAHLMSTSISPAPQVQACSASYEVTKTLFLSRDELHVLTSADAKTRRQLSELAFMRFKAWEADNPETVERLKAYYLGVAV